ncbi:Cell division control protein 48-like C, partial [Cucurbita argyrosperma subsp. sororia]
MAGGRSPSVVNRGFLLQRIKSCRHKCPTVDDIVDHLQSTYRDYRGLKKSPFTSIVQQTLDSQLKKNPKSTPSTSTPSKIKRQFQDSEDEDADCSTIEKKRYKRVDLGEQRLQNESPSSSTSSDSGNSGDGAVATSEDAVYGEKVEPAFDLMKSMLQTSYAESNKSKNEHLEKSVELEVAIENKIAEKIGVENEGNASKGILRKEGQGSHGGAETETGEGKEEGPRFKDLGGMKSVLEELKMEVIVPLYHPQLPMWLGVRPMAGILLHGPPGCGKTKLAHAIANETGVPFYKISAPEIVSGVSARATPGFVGADLTALANKAGNLAMKRIVDQRKFELSTDFVDKEHIEDWWKQPWLPEEMEKLAITMTDFEEAIQMIQPSLRREGFSAIPSVKWEDVGGLEQLRAEFDRYVVRRIKHPDDYEGFVRTLFSRARTCSPCILFFDEVDALTTKRGKEGGWVVERLLNQLLIELDGAEQRRGVFVIGATNRPEVMDPAVLRSGRFGKLLYVPLPGPTERGLVLKALGRKKPIDISVDLLAVGQMEACENFSGADLSALMNEAAMAALEEKLTSVRNNMESASCTIKMTHFESGLTKISPSVSEKQKHFYEILSKSLKPA